MHPRIARRRETVRQSDEVVADMVDAAEEERRRWAEAPPSRRSPLALWIAAAAIITAWAVVMAILLSP